MKFVKSFIELCSYYRQFEQAFAEKAKPLMDLTKYKILFIWGPAQQNSFNVLKQCLTNVAVLTYPDYTKTFKIHPDACGYELGAKLLQRVDWVERSLVFESRVMTTSERNFSITKKECLALVWAVKKFRSYIWGYPIRIVTDHHALCWNQ